MLTELYNKHKAKHGDVGYKAGTVLIHKLNFRYGQNAKFEKLTSENILCHADASIVLTIERTLIEILLKHDKCMNSHVDNGSLSLTEGYEGKVIVYLVRLRDDLFVCPHRCYIYATHDIISDHLLNFHPHVVDWHEFENQAREGGHQEASHALLEPVRYHHKSWNSTRCEHCDEKYETKEKLNEHRRTCVLDPDPKYPCLHPSCNIRSASFDHFEKHAREHARQEVRVERKLAHVCQFCSQSFPCKRNKDRHEMACKLNPDREKNRSKCEICQKTFSRAEQLKNHKCVPAASSSSKF